MASITVARLLDLAQAAESFVNAFDSIAAFIAMARDEAASDPAEALRTILNNLPPRPPSRVIDQELGALGRTAHQQVNRLDAAEAHRQRMARTRHITRQVAKDTQQDIQWPALAIPLKPSPAPAPSPDTPSGAIAPPRPDAWDTAAASGQEIEIDFDGTHHLTTQSKAIK